MYAIIYNLFRLAQMFKNVAQKIQNYLFQTQTQIDIHLSTSKHVSKTALKNFRIISWVTMTLVLILLFRVSKSLFINMKFLSDQGFIITWLYFGLVVQDYWVNNVVSKHGFSISPRMKFVVELVFELALCLQVPITIIEWTLLFADQVQTQTTQQIIVQILEHSLPIILLVLDLFCNNYRFLRSRLLFVITYSFFYLIVNLTYSLKVEPVYDIITWKDYQSYIYVVVVLILMVGTHFLARFVYVKTKKVQQEEQNKILANEPKLSQRKSQRQMKSEQNNEGSIQS